MENFSPAPAAAAASRPAEQPRQPQARAEGGGRQSQQFRRRQQQQQQLPPPEPPAAAAAVPPAAVRWHLHAGEPRRGAPRSALRRRGEPGEWEVRAAGVPGAQPRPPGVLLPRVRGRRVQGGVHLLELLHGEALGGRPALRRHGQVDETPPICKTEHVI